MQTLNKFIVDYSTDHLYLWFEGNDYHFDLNEGDCGDFWHSFEHKGELYDVNFYAESELDYPCLSVYPIVTKSDGSVDYDAIDYNNYILVDCCEEFGDREKYLTGYQK
jgi:hypothetical protein